jgi:hypothetical protein
MEQKIEQPMYYSPASSARRSNAWVGGAVLMLIGGILLLQNFDLFHLRNGWALFFLIPVIFNLVSAYGVYQRHGRFTPAVFGSLMGVLVLLGLMSAFLFDVSWGTLWPLFLILGGLSLLFSSVSR